MNLLDYQPLALRTEKLLPLPIDRLMHAALGIDTETGELNTIIKRIAIYGKQWTDIGDKEKGLTFLQCAGEEIADVCWYVAIACDAMGTSIASLSDGWNGSKYPLDEIALNLATMSGKFADITVYAKSRKHQAFGAADRSAALDVLDRLMRVLNSACATIGLDLGALLDANIDKLRERFPERYTDEAAEARADKAGVDARNS